MNKNYNKQSKLPPVLNVNESADSKSYLEKIPEKETVHAESAFYIRLLTDDWVSINHIEEKMFQNEKNGILNKYNSGNRINGELCERLDSTKNPKRERANQMDRVQIKNKVQTLQKQRH